MKKLGRKKESYDTPTSICKSSIKALWSQWKTHLVELVQKSVPSSTIRRMR